MDRKFVMDIVNTTRINALKVLGLNKPKQHQSLCLHYIAKQYKIKYNGIKKQELIDKIIEYETTNNIITDLTNNNSYVDTQEIHNLSYQQRKEQLERLNFNKTKQGHTTCIKLIAQRYNLSGLSYMNKGAIINEILKYELNHNIITGVIPTTPANPQFSYEGKWLYTIRIRTNVPYNPRRFYFPEHMVYEFRYIDFVKHLHNINTLGLEYNYLYHISQLRENEIIWINQYATAYGYNVNIDITWVNENDDFSTQHYINEKYKIKDKNADLLKNIKDVVWDNHSECSSCAICMCDFEEKEVIKSLKCKHNFHSECIKEWVLREPKCPCCRTEIN